MSDSGVEDDLIRLFRRFDTKGDGLIGRHDLSKLLMALDPAFWTLGRLERLLAQKGASGDGSVSYEDFLRWLFGENGGQEAGPPAVVADAAGGGGCGEPARFTLMTFNVEEYCHGESRGSRRERALEIAAGIRRIVEAHAPDVLCLEEHSLGGGEFTEEEILAAVAGGLGYDHTSEATGERAWYSELANAVLWKRGTFALERSWGVRLAGKGVEGPARDYTPRSAACAELRHSSSGRRVTVCATHLLGGRFEDTVFVKEARAEQNMRVEQARRLASSVRETCGESTPSVIAGDFNVMLDGYGEQSPFRKAALDYFNGKLLGAALAKAQGASRDEFTFDGFYVPFQTRVHGILSDELGYRRAYGRSDASSEMKTTFYAGCIDWIYIRHLQSMRDEKVVSAIQEGLSDHNAVLVTLQFE